MGLTKGAVTRFAKKAGAQRVAADLYGAVEEMYVDVLDKVLGKVLLLTKNRKKKLFQLTM